MESGGGRGRANKQKVGWHRDTHTHTQKKRNGDGAKGGLQPVGRGPYRRERGKKPDGTSWRRKKERKKHNSKVRSTTREGRDGRTAQDQHRSGWLTQRIKEISGDRRQRQEEK
jgi:hypothetical protein